MIERLFHYTSFESCLKIVESSALKATSPIGLNDPFECLPRIRKRSDYSNEELELFFDKHSKEKTELFQTAYHKWEERGKLGDFKDFFKNFHDLEPAEFKKQMAERLRFISFSQKHDIWPMWEHYSGSRSGVVIEFNLKVMPFSGALESEELLKIDYSEDRVIYDHLKSELSRDVARKEKRPSLHTDLKKVYTTKQKFWEHEYEVRLVLPTNIVPDPVLDEYFRFDEVGDLFMNLGPNSIKKIYCGMEMSPVNYSIIRSLCKSKSSGAYIKLVKVKLPDDSFGLVEV